MWRVRKEEKNQRERERVREGRETESGSSPLDSKSTSSAPEKSDSHVWRTLARRMVLRWLVPEALGAPLAPRRARLPCTRKAGDLQPASLRPLVLAVP